MDKRPKNVTVNNVTNFECQVKTDVNGVYRRTLKLTNSNCYKKKCCEIFFVYVALWTSVETVVIFINETHK